MFLSWLSLPEYWKHFQRFFIFILLDFLMRNRGFKKPPDLKQHTNKNRTKNRRNRSYPENFFHSEGGHKGVDCNKLPLSLDNQEKQADVLAVLLWRSRGRSEEPKFSIRSRVRREQGAHLLVESQRLKS